MLIEKHTVLETRVRALEGELQACGQRAVTLFNEVPAPYFLLDQQGRIVEVNIAGCSLLGRPREELLQRALTAYLPPISRSSFTLLSTHTFEDGLAHHGDVQLLNAEGVPGDVLVQLRAQARDGVAQLLVIATNMTAHKRAQQSLLDDAADQGQRLREQARDPAPHAGAGEHHLHIKLHRTALEQLPGAVQAPVLNAEGAVLQILNLLASVDRFMQLRLTMRAMDLNKALKEVLKNAAPIMADRDVRVTSPPAGVARSMAWVAVHRWWCQSGVSVQIGE